MTHCDLHSGPCEDYERVWGEPHPPIGDTIIHVSIGPIEGGTMKTLEEATNERPSLLEHKEQNPRR